MAKTEWGEKRICLSCGGKFYDMLRSPIICPNCGTEFVPVKSSRGSRTKAKAPVAMAPKPDAGDENAELVSDDDEELPDDTDLEILDGEDKEEDDADEAVLHDIEGITEKSGD